MKKTINILLITLSIFGSGFLTANDEKTTNQGPVNLRFTRHNDTEQTDRLNFIAFYSQTRASFNCSNGYSINALLQHRETLRSVIENPAALLEQNRRNLFVQSLLECDQTLVTGAVNFYTVLNNILTAVENGHQNQLALIQQNSDAKQLLAKLKDIAEKYQEFPPFKEQNPAVWNSMDDVLGRIDLILGNIQY